MPMFLPARPAFSSHKVLMKQDLDLMRVLVLGVEAADAETLADPVPVCGGASVGQISEHVRWLIEGGYLLGVELQDAPVAGTRGEGVGSVSGCVFGQLRLTFAGCELASLAREPKRWAKVKSAERFTGGLSLGVAVELLTHYARQDVGVLPPR